MINKIFKVLRRIAKGDVVVCNEETENLDECYFCGGDVMIDEHKKDCPVTLSREVLEEQIFELREEIKKLG